MALPSSGQISFNNVRTETSQSAFTDYEFSGWASGQNGTFTSFPAQARYPDRIYAPINLLSSGSRYSASPVNQLEIQNLSMSAWYNYDHTTTIGLSTTASLYLHVSDTTAPCSPSSMIPVDVGTTSATLSLNISGTNDLGPFGGGCWAIFYGKPWSVNGSGSTSLDGCNVYYPAETTLIASGTLGGYLSSVTRSIQYNYNYDVNKGQNIYYVIYGYEFCYCGGSC